MENAVLGVACIGIHQLMDDGTLGPEKEVQGFPDGAKINFVSWSHDGRHLSFSIRFDEELNDNNKLRLWIADVETGKAKPLFQSPHICLNAVFDKFAYSDSCITTQCIIRICISCHRR